jgi:hypothetical protein
MESDEADDSARRGSQLAGRVRSVRWSYPNSGYRRNHTWEWPQEFGAAQPA